MGFRDNDAYQAMKYFPRLLKLDRHMSRSLEASESEGRKIYTLGQLVEYYDFVLEEGEATVEYDRFVPGLKREAKAQRTT